DGLGRVAAHDGVGLDVAGYHRPRPNQGAVTDFYSRHDNRLGPYPHVVADHGVARGPIPVFGTRETGHFRHVVEREGADPVVPVSLVARDDEGRARADGTEAADDQPIDVGAVRHQIAGAVIEAVAVVVARVIAVAAGNDVG